MKYRKSIAKNNISLWLMLFFCINAKAQYNLVPNSSFENYQTCPSSLLTATPPPPWYIPTSVNYQCCSYANACSNNNFSCSGVPYNCVGILSYQQAHSGDAYVLITCYDISFAINNRRYQQSKLKDSLKAGKSYYVEFYISLINSMAYGCNNVSMLFTKTAQYVDTIIDPNGLIVANAQIINYGNPIIKDTMNWVKVSGIFKAQGGEQFITLGNFKDDNHTDTVTVNFSSSIAYGSGFYLDDVSVIPLDSLCLKADAGKDTTITAGDSVFIGSYTNGIDTIKWYNASGQLIDSVQPGFWVKPNATGSYSYIVEQVVNGCYSRDTVLVNVVLPLRMLSYELRIMNERQVLNKWETANEVNVSHFNIQRSTNAKDFTTIGKVKALNNSYNEYSYVDNSPPVEGLGVVYYRFQAVDKDGKLNYSQIKSLNIQHSSSSISVFPNPAKDVVNIYCKEVIKEVKLFNIMGQQINQLKVNSEQLKVDIKGFSKGIYLFQIETKKGRIINEKVIVE